MKKLLSPRTGLHPEDQKLIYKGKVRSSKAYLDLSGVKDGSKMVVVEDAAAQAKRFLETRRQAKIDKSSKSISQIGLDVDKLASEVTHIRIDNNILQTISPMHNSYECLFSIAFRYLHWRRSYPKVAESRRKMW